jgi:hypothetical protein
MFSEKLKGLISVAVQGILKATKHSELPEGEVTFILHVDGKTPMSWANITNKNGRYQPIPIELIKNRKGVE